MTAVGPAVPRAGARSLVSRVVRWRDWRLPVKLLAVSLTPLLFLVALGVLTIRTDVHDAGTYGRVNDLVGATGQLRALVRDVQQERTTNAQLVSSGRALTLTGPTPGQHETDMAATATLHTFDTVPGLRPTTRANYQTARTQLRRLPGLRQAAVAGRESAAALVTDYSAVTDALLDLGRSVAAEVGQPSLSPTALALSDLQAVREETSLQQSIVGAGIAAGGRTPQQAAQTRDSAVRLATRRADLESVASPDQWRSYQRTVAGPQITARNRMLQLAFAMPGAQQPTDLTATAWSASSTATLTRMDQVAAGLANHLRTTSAHLQNRASNKAGIASVILFAAVIAAGLVTFTITRHLLRSLGVLRRSALDAAERQLPSAVESIRAGRVEEARVVPVPVDSQDEIGELARSFDAMQDQALHLAVEQAALRSNYRDVFVNLSRRSESLVQRQLGLIERLERDEEDPDQLSTLFALDHLATRMRRNNENLMVLSGSESSRRFSQPLALADVLRAAVSEIEQYQRVTVQPPAQVSIVGYAASDLVRLLAELLDNATTFSAPNTHVTMGTYPAREKGLSIDMLDQGIGMTDEEVEEANARLSSGAELEVSTSRRMGLFVVGRLSERHGIRVRLHGGEEISGLRVTVTVPAALMANAAADTTSRPPAPRTHSNGNGNGSGNGHKELTPKALGDFDPSTTVPATPALPPVNGAVVVPPPPTAPVEEPAAAGQLAAAEEPAAAEPETEPADESTPIYDAVVSAWFTTEGAQPPQWESAGDEGWKAAQTALESAPGDLTAAGLPKRKPGARVLPGGLGGDSAPRRSGSPEQDAEQVRGRLGSFQRGLQQGRHSVTTPRPPAGTAPTPKAPAKSPAKSPEQKPARTHEPKPAEPVRSAAELTAAGLPRRTPGARIMPGSVDVATTRATSTSEQDAEQVRGRLGSFQRGLQQGRESVADPGSHGSNAPHGSDTEQEHG